MSSPIAGSGHKPNFVPTSPLVLIRQFLKFVLTPTTLSRPGCSCFHVLDWFPRVSRSFAVRSASVVGLCGVADDVESDKTAAPNLLKGQVMKLSKGKANPALVGEILERKLRN
jgi:hypothetical protein